MNGLKTKQRRLRLNPTHRWTANETKSLLTTILDEVKDKPDSFEQPTAYQFYKRISAKSIELQGIDLRVYKNKMRNLKTNYIKASWMKRNKTYDPAVDEKIRSICPFWNLLDKLFAQTKKEKQAEEVIHVHPDPVPDITVVDISNYFIKTSEKIGMPIKILGRPRNSSRNIAALSRLVEIHDNKLQFETFKWQKERIYNNQQLELKQAQFELRLMELEEEFEKRKEEMLLHESEALNKLKLRGALLERITIHELSLKQQ